MQALESDLSVNLDQPALYAGTLEGAVWGSRLDSQTRHRPKRARKTLDVDVR